MIQLIEVCELLKANKSSAQQYTLRDIYINPKHVISLREDDNFKRKLNEGILPGTLKDTHTFTRVTLDKGQTGLELVVVGPPHIIEMKLKGGERELLQG
tara:strand:- start:228 stop:524 length:297 start_codon:yes stop_codon:yes gene_type:complete